MASRGCRKSDFIGDFENKIALLFRGNCSFETKINNALVAKASAVVVINNDTDTERVFVMDFDGESIFHLRAPHTI